MLEPGALTIAAVRPYTLVATALVATALISGCHEDRSITMPNLVGLPQPEAQRKLEGLGLRWQFGGSERIITRAPRPLEPGTFFFPDPNEDPVVSQDPPVGKRVPEGELVELETVWTMLRFRNRACL